MKRALLILLALIGNAPAADQSDSNSNVWFGYIGDHPIGDGPWGLHLESQMRRVDYGRNWQQFLVRPGINYTVSSTLSLSAGYLWADTHAYGDIPVAADFPEHRFWEQALISHKALGIDWQHRFRLEQRRIGEMTRQNGEWEVGNWRYENRIRYMLRASVHLDDAKKWYLAVSNELFFNFGSNVAVNYFDQNRAFIGLGRHLNPHTRLEIGYMEQTLQRRGGAVWENNHTVTVMLMSKWPFKF